MRREHQPPALVGMTRRRFLRAVGALGAWGVAASGVTAIVAACGSKATTPPPGTASASTSPSAGTPAPTPTSAAGSVAPSTAAGLTLRQKIGRMLVVGFRGTEYQASDPILKAIAKGELGGVILFDRDLQTGTRGRNITSPAQLAKLTEALHGAYPPDASGRFIVAIDQEGGVVARLNQTDGYSATESEAQLGARNDLAHTTDVASAIATDLVDAGIDLNLAPVVDLNVNPKNPAIGALGRSFGASVDLVVAHAGAVIDAHHGAGVLCCIKHFPGEGSATGNTDTGVVDVTGTWKPIELEPFARLVADGSPDAVMVGNVVDRNVDPRNPLSLSKASITGTLRGRLGWDGVVITDDLQAGAIRAAYKHADAVRLAIEAGVDVLLFANQQQYDAGIVESTIAVVSDLVQAGTISEARIDESVARIEGMTAPID